MATGRTPLQGGRRVYTQLRYAWSRDVRAHVFGLTELSNAEGRLWRVQQHVTAHGW